MDEAASCPNAVWTGGPIEEEGGRCPSPGFLDKMDVEDVALVCKVVGSGKRVREVGEDGIGSIEVSVVDYRVTCTEDDGEDEGDEGCAQHE